MSRLRTSAHFPPPMAKWRSIGVTFRSADSGGDALDYEWLDQDHLALYFIGVTAHGLDSAPISVAIVNVIRSCFVADSDLHQLESVLNALNQGFPGS